MTITTAVDDRWGHWSEGGLPPDISGRLTGTGVYSDEAIDSIVAYASELEVLLEHRPPSEAVGQFLAADDTWAGQCDRFATVRIMERLSNLRVPALDWHGMAAEDPHLRRRPLSAIEIGLVRHCALRSIGRTTVVGALDSGVASGELPLLSPDHVFRTVDGKTTVLNLPGTERDIRSGYPAAAPRSTGIAPWAQRAFAKVYAAAAAAEGPLLYTGSSKSVAKQQSCLLMAVGAVLRDAGLAGDPTVKPLSIRNTAGRAMHTAHGIERAATMLGHDDLNSVAREIGLKPHRPPRRN